MSTIQTVNPFTGQLLREYPADSVHEIERTIRAAQDAFLLWRDWSFQDRGSVMRRVAELLRERRDAYARLMAEEMGKPVREGAAEIDKCAWACKHFAVHAENYLRDEAVATDAKRSYVTYKPLGVLLAIMPWNYPFWQVFRFAAPALMAGNAALLKHAANVTACSLAIEELFRDAGFPDGVFQSLLVPGIEMEGIIANPIVRGISLTGSTPAGRSVASMAGRYLKKTVLELGGSDPFVVLKDADLDLAASTAVQARMLCGGQSCIAAKRFIVVDAVYDAFESRFIDRMRQIHVGDPLNPETEAGPLARMDLRDELHRQVEESVAKGAERKLGGEIPDRPGAFYPPTVLGAVAPGMPAYHEELFGPVAALIRAKDEDHAIEIANDTDFGLGAAVFTRDIHRGERIAANKLNAGSCFVNGLVKSDPRLPFGGIKDSGYGRELGKHGILEMVNIKTVYVG